MKKFLAAVVILAGSLSNVLTAQAATLGLTTGETGLTATSATVNYLEIATDGELFAFDGIVDSAIGAQPNGAAEVSFAIGFPLADPTLSSDFAFGGFLDVVDDDGQFLTGDLAAIGFVPDVIELQFDNLSGSGSDQFGSSVLVTVAFTSMLGTNPFEALVSDSSLSATVNIVEVAAVPLPAGLGLLASGLVGLAWFRRRQHELQQA